LRQPAGADIATTLRPTGIFAAGHRRRSVCHTPVARTSQGV